MRAGRALVGPMAGATTRIGVIWRGMASRSRRGGLEKGARVNAAGELRRAGGRPPAGHDEQLGSIS
jgi:hypothetical protein